MIANGGRKIKPTLIDRIQDRYGHTIYQHDERVCDGCDADTVGGPGRADARRQARAGARSDDRLPDHLDDGGRRAARHRHGGAGGRQADRRQDRHHQRRQGRLVHRLLARPRGRRLSSATTSRADLGSGATGGVLAAPIFTEFMKVGARRQAADAVPRAARHEAHPDRRQDGPARRAGGDRRDPRSLQAGHRAARHLLDHRRHRRRRPSARGLARGGSRRAHRQRAVLTATRRRALRASAPGRRIDPPFAVLASHLTNSNSGHDAIGR